MNHVLIYAFRQSDRLRYVLDFIFTEILDLDVSVTSDRDEWLNYPGIKINYATERMQVPGELYIKAGNLLWEEDIHPIPLNIGRWKHTTVLFYNQPGALIPFDLFAAVFYLLSRYEEYLPYTPDPHGRFPAAFSAAGQFAFVDMPVVDLWIQQLKKLMEQQWNCPLPENTFSFRPTFDIDIAYAYLHRSKAHQIGGMLKSAGQLKIGGLGERIQVLSGMKHDPYDTYGMIAAQCAQYHYEPLYFFLLGNGGPYDKNLPADSKVMQDLIKATARKAAVGIHPSYQSNEGPVILQKEISILADTIGHPVTKSRQHYIRLRLPHTYHMLLDAGIREDYSMGYPEVNGFRAGTCFPFYWFDLEKNKVTQLRVFPFVMMDATCIFYQKWHVKQATHYVRALIDTVKSVNGHFTAVFHNHFIGNGIQFRGWQQFYKDILAYASH